MITMRSVVITFGLVLLLAGCETRSISNSGYPGDGRGNPLYRGELSEFDVIGIDPQGTASDADIAAQFTEYRKLTLRRRQPIMVIQSGALLPDEPMLRALDQTFTTTPFSGVPVRPIGGWVVQPGRGDDGNYAKLLRLAAAKGGYEIIVCYWGVLETAVERHATKLVSWVPVVGSAIPDESQLMRIRLRVAVIDVKSGRWSMFSPEAFSDTALTAALIRRQSDQDQVGLLKEKAYQAAVAEFVARYVE
jgi:hypothetical protein